MSTTLPSRSVRLAWSESASENTQRSSGRVRRLAKRAAFVAAMIGVLFGAPACAVQCSVAAGGCSTYPTRAGYVNGGYSGSSAHVTTFGGPKFNGYVAY